jgi:Fe-S-cluster-containing hydrogenase component 2
MKIFTIHTPNKKYTQWSHTHITGDTTNISEVFPFTCVTFKRHHLMFSRMKALYYDSERCVACRNCEVACAMAWKGTTSIHQALTAPLRPKTRIFLFKQDKSTIILSCRHCEIPPCKEACPVDAIEKLDDGTVVVDAGLCIGCRSCTIACPIGVIQPDDRDQIMIKCDLCTNREDGPACISACPTNALVYGEFSQIIKERRGKA